MPQFCRELRASFGGRMQLVVTGVRAGYIALPKDDEARLRALARRFGVSLTTIRANAWPGRGIGVLSTGAV